MIKYVTVQIANKVIEEEFQTQRIVSLQSVFFVEKTRPIKYDNA